MTAVRQTLTSRNLLSCLAAAVALSGVGLPRQAHAEASPEAAPASVKILVLRENGAGSRTAAQKYIDKLVEVLAQLNAWPAAKGAYLTSRTKATKYIAAEQPEFGMFSFGAFLGMADAHKLEAIGTAKIKAGGGQYFLISKSQLTFAACKGKKLATNHSQDPAFIDNVVSGDAFDLKDFEVVPMRRPVQTLKAVIDGEADCALVDDAQLGFLADIEGGPTVRAVWSSESFPSVVVVQFPNAGAARGKTMRDNLDKVCVAGKSACDAAGMDSLEAAKAADFAGYRKSYKGG